MSQKFPKEYRLRRSAEFQRVYRAKKSVADHFLILYSVANGMDHTRIGLSVSRKIGNAVVRNRWKRCIREAFRINSHQLSPGLDMVILPKRGVPCPGTVIIARSLLGFQQKLTGKNDCLREK